MAETQQPDCQRLQQRDGEPEARIEPLIRSGRQRLLLMVAVLLLLVAAGVSTSLAVRAWRVARQTRAAADLAMRERWQAQQAETEAKHQRDQAREAEAKIKHQRDQALAAKKETQQSEQITKAALAFLQNNVLSAGHRNPWDGVGPSKDLTLRQAVDMAASKVAEAFVDQPLVEASVREILGSTYLDLGETDRAIRQYERSLALREAILGPDNRVTGDCRNQLAVAYRLAGRAEEASRLFKQNRLSRPHAAALSVQGSALLAQNKPFEAELMLRECLAIRRKIQPDDWTTFDAQAMLGAALLDQKKYAETEQLLLSGYEGMKQREAQIPRQQWGRLTRALERLVRLYEAWGKPSEASKWRKELATVNATKKP